MNILLAGGAGNIASNTAVQLLDKGHNVVIVDNYSHTSPEVISRIEKITTKKVSSYEADIMDKSTVG